MKLTVNIPLLIEVDDYHEFKYLSDYYKQLSNKIKIKELGCMYKYYGIVYLKQNIKYKKIVKKFKEDKKQWIKRNG